MVRGGRPGICDVQQVAEPLGSALHARGYTAEASEGLWLGEERFYGSITDVR